MKQKVFCVKLQALRVNVIKCSTNKTSDTPLCRFCNEKTESIKHIVNACTIFLGPITRLVTTCTGCCVRKITLNVVTSGTHTQTRTHTRAPQPVQENDECKIFWDFNIEHRQPGAVSIDK